MLWPYAAWLNITSVTVLEFLIVPNNRLMRYVEVQMADDHLHKP